MRLVFKISMLVIPVNELIEVRQVLSALKSPVKSTSRKGPFERDMLKPTYTLLYCLQGIRGLIALPRLPLYMAASLRTTLLVNACLSYTHFCKRKCFPLFRHAFQWTSRALFFSFNVFLLF